MSVVFYLIFPCSTFYRSSSSAAALLVDVERERFFFSSVACSPCGFSKRLPELLFEGFFRDEEQSRSSQIHFQL